MTHDTPHLNICSLYFNKTKKTFLYNFSLTFLAFISFFSPILSTYSEWVKSDGHLSETTKTTAHYLQFVFFLQSLSLLIREDSTDVQACRPCDLSS